MLSTLGARFGRGPAVLAAAGLLLAGGAAPAQPPGESGHVARTAELRIRLTPRTPDQIAAFYTARGFPEPMVSALREMCFVTAVVSNTSDRVMWHDLDQWRFTTPEGPLPRVRRTDWRARWARLDAPAPSRATFRWTLLPERLDFRPGESEGGNIVLPRTVHPIAVEARFAAGGEGGAPVVLRLENLRCPPEGTAP